MDLSSTGPTHSKAEQRRCVRRTRAALSEYVQAERGAALAEVLTGEISPDSLVAAYFPMSGEPDVMPFLLAHIRRGGRVWLPVVADVAARRLQWAAWDPQTPMTRRPTMPLQEPAGPRKETAELLDHAPLALLIPALAVDAVGARLGQGGGFYDTMFAQHRKLEQVQRLAVVHPEEILPAGSFPVEDHDLRTPAAATWEGIVPLDGSSCEASAGDSV